jgi:acetylornithine aminotransferase
MTGGLTQRWSASMMNNYGQPSLALVRGEGAVVWDEAGKSYVDLLGGIAVNVLGHAHPASGRRRHRPDRRLGHVSNLFVAEPPVALAEQLSGRPGDRPGVLRQLRRRGERGRLQAVAATGRTQVVSAEGAFHGRTMGALALTGQTAKADPFRPLPGDVTHVPYGDAGAWRRR